MKTKLGIFVLVVAMSFGMMVVSANAALVSSLSGGTVVPMPVLSEPDFWGTGPRSFGPGITFTSNYVYTLFGYQHGYGFDYNGSWDGLVMAGANSADGVMTFTFDTLVSGVGGFINYATQGGYEWGIPMIAVYNAAGELIEQAQLSFDTGGGQNSGFFLGFQEGDAIIKSFTLSNAFIGITDLTIVSGGITSVPEPGTMVLMSFGLIGVGIASRRAKSDS